MCCGVCVQRILWLYSHGKSWQHSLLVWTGQYYNGISFVVCRIALYQGIWDEKENIETGFVASLQFFIVIFLYFLVVCFQSWSKRSLTQHVFSTSGASSIHYITIMTSWNKTILVNNSTNGKFTIFAVVFIILFTITFSLGIETVDGDRIKDPRHFQQGPITHNVVLLSVYGLLVSCNFIFSSEARVFLSR